MNELKRETSANAGNKQESNLSYVLITPARNEAAFIEETIKSVLRQTILPVKWVIVSDGSTDGTDDIVNKYAAENGWIDLLRIPEGRERNSFGKVHAFNTGYGSLSNIEYNIIGNLDADISFDEDYFDFLLKKFVNDPKLGVAGTPFREGMCQYDYRFSRKEHVSGACQLFRRECFESIGGYVPLMAGEDVVAVVTARMKGWKTETFTEKICIHHRPMGTAKDHILIANFKSGYGDYPLGVHPLWQLLRSFYQMSRKPIISGGIIHMAGYFWAMVRRAQELVSMEFVHFRRKEQMRWLNEYFRRILPLLR